jgi:uncharacterized membrane protein
MKKPNLVGLAFGTLFYIASLTPSLVPRHWVFQAIVTGIVTALGYGIGSFASYLWRRFSLWEPGSTVKRAAWWALVIGVPIALVFMTIRGVDWQRDLHDLMDMPAPSPWGYVAALPLAIAEAALLVAIGRGIRWLGRRIGGVLARWIPRRVAGVVAIVLVAFLIIGFLDGVVGRVLLSTADDAFRVSDQLVEDGLSPPSSALRSGSAGSLAAWKSLGSEGRKFVVDGPDERVLDDFSRRPTSEPIRVYAGLASEQRVSDRAALVVEELERAGAFDRAVLCVMTTTGTGWIDPEAASALEYLWAGDTALATMQYSYLPSWISFLVDSERAREAGAVLFNAVYERWAALPENDRPRLLVFGESLGAYGSEAAFSGTADLRNRTDGALWVGPPNFSELWSAFTERRDPGSPERLPVYDGGATVRFAAAPGDLAQPAAPWYKPRVVYLQHASDPIVWWSPRLIARRPAWLVEEPGTDVLPDVAWYPLVTFWQVTADMAGADRVPPGHAHEYAGLFADAWAAIARPPRWSREDTARLRSQLMKDAGAGG